MILTMSDMVCTIHGEKMTPYKRLTDHEVREWVCSRCEELVDACVDEDGEPRADDEITAPGSFRWAGSKWVWDLGDEEDE